VQNLAAYSPSESHDFEKKNVFRKRLVLRLGVYFEFYRNSSYATGWNVQLHTQQREYNCTLYDGLERTTTYTTKRTNKTQYKAWLNNTLQSYKNQLTSATSVTENARPVIVQYVTAWNIQLHTQRREQTKKLYIVWLGNTLQRYRNQLTSATNVMGNVRPVIVHYATGWNVQLHTQQREHTKHNTMHDSIILYKGIRTSSHPLQV